MKTTKVNIVLPQFISGGYYESIHDITWKLSKLGVKGIHRMQVNCVQNDVHVDYYLLYPTGGYKKARLVKKDISKFCKDNPDYKNTHGIRKEYNKILAKYFK